MLVLLPASIVEINVEKNDERIPANTISVSFDIVNMYPIIDNDRGIAVVTNVSETKAYKSQSTHCIIAGLGICLKCNNSRFGSQNLLQLNGTVTGASNSCLYVDLAVFDIDKSVLQAKGNTFQEMRYFGRYRDEKLELFLMFLNSIDSNLWFTIEVGGNKLCVLDLK